MARMIIYPDPINSQCQLTSDSGWSIFGTVSTDGNNRPCQVFDIPDTTPNRWGCSLSITFDNKLPFSARGLLAHESLVWNFYLDDVKLLDVPPPVIIYVPEPTPPKPPVNSSDPWSIIKSVYATGKFDLLTKESCGKFTEACCTSLHELNSPEWGHLKKHGAQNNYNGHAVDAVQLLTDVGSTTAGIYDIIQSSESPDAKPAFNWVGSPSPSDWYYPA